MNNPKTTIKDFFCLAQDKLFIMLTEMQASIVVKTAQVIPMVLDHRYNSANTSYAKLATDVQSKLVSSIYEAEGLFCVKLCHIQCRCYLQPSAKQHEL